MQRMQIYFTILCFSFAIDANGSSSSDHPLTESSFSGRRSIFNSPLFNEALLGQFTQDPVSQQNRNLLSDFNSLRISQSGMNSIYSSSSLKSLNQNLINIPNGPKIEFDNHPQDFFYVIVDPLHWHVTCFTNKWST